VIFSGLEMILGGTAVGAGLGMWSGFLIWNLLYGMYPADVGALVAAESVLMLASTIVCFVPALRATRVDPVSATRAT
jgi:ABC-type antimicrobial peptide transport system permease subunit